MHVSFNTRNPPVVLAVAVLLYLAVPALTKHGAGEANDDDDAAAASASSSSSTPTSSTSSVPSPTPSAPSFQFLQPGNTTICQNIMLRWQATNLTSPITLTVTNDRATGSAGVNDNVLISRTLSTNVTASANQYMWVDVDVPQGFYVAVAFDTTHTTGVFSQSPPFYVQAGQDSSCLTTSSTSPGSPTSSTSSTSTASQSDPSSPTPTSSATAEPDTAQPKKLSPAVLGGVVAGVVVGVMLLILIFTIPPYWKEFHLKRARARRPGGPYYLF